MLDFHEDAASVLGADHQACRGDRRLKMKVTERKLGRVFHLQLEAGDDFFSNVNPFVKEKNIRAGSVFIFGALREMDMITGFKSMNGYDVDRRHFDEWRER